LYSQRKASGSIFERHPSMEEARATLKELVQIDYSSLD
jgi:hypothetical protein